LSTEPFADNARFLIRPLDVTRAEERQRLIADIQLVFCKV
jgi:hypothetical protein